MSAVCALAQPTRKIAMATALAAIAISGASAVAAPAQAQALKKVLLPMDGGGPRAPARSYSYYVSSKAAHDGYNLVVFALPDDGQTAEQFAQSSGWIKVAEDNGFAVVFPEPAAPAGPGEGEGEGAGAGPVGPTWSPVSGGEDAYLMAVFQSASTHMTAAAGPDDRTPRPGGAGGRGGAGGAGGAGPGPGRGGPGGGGGPPEVRISTWNPWQYFTGAGAGARVAQEFVMNNPGLVAAVATLDGTVFRATYEHGDETAQGYFQNQRGGKTAVPMVRPLKKDVPVPAWLFTAGAANADEAKLATYWKHSNGVTTTATTSADGGFQTAIYANPDNRVEQVRITTLPAGAKYDEATASAIGDFFSHIARWPSTPNGELGTMMTQPEVNRMFEVRETKVGDLTYNYYVKTPSSYAKGKSLPLVISLHGGGYPAWMYLSQIKWHELGEKEGFITVYLGSPHNGWDFADPEGASAHAIGQVIDEMAANYGVDRSRVYLQGFSIGSAQTFVEGTTHPQLFAAVSPNSGFGDFGAAARNAALAVKAKGDIRLPMMVVYGAEDAVGTTDGFIPAQSALAVAIKDMKAYDGVTTPDTVKLYDSPHAKPYEILLPGGKLDPPGIPDPTGRMERYDYLSADTKQPIFTWVWVRDMPHNTVRDQAKMIWDFFKNWRRNPDGSLTYAAR